MVFFITKHDTASPISLSPYLLLFTTIHKSETLKKGIKIQTPIMCKYNKTKLTII